MNTEAKEIELTIEVSLGATLPTANYANTKPSLLTSMKYKYFGTVDEAKKESADRHSQLYKALEEKINQIAEESKISWIKSQYAKLRFTKVTFPDGTSKSLPHCSNICSFDRVGAEVDEESLKQYGAQGTLADIRNRHFILTGVYESDYLKIGGGTELEILKRGNLRLQPTTFCFPSFLKKYPIEKMQNGEFTYSQKYEFCGTPDFTGIFEGKRYVCDWKRTPDKAYFKQLAGYAIALEERGAEPFEGLMLIGINPDNQQNFSKPITTTEVDACKKMFLDQRENFRKVFSI